PVDEVAFEHGAVARDDPAPFVGSEPFRIRARREEIVDRAVDVFLHRRCTSQRLCLHYELLSRSPCVGEHVVNASRDGMTPPVTAAWQRTGLLRPGRQRARRTATFE